MYGKLQFHPTVEQFLSRLANDPSLSSSVRKAARCLGVSTSHLQHLLKQETGRTYGELIRANRAERAKELLISQPHRIISEIAYQVGVAPQTLTRDFMRAFGCNPAEFRRRQRGADAATPVLAKQTA